MTLIFELCFYDFILYIIIKIQVGILSNLKIIIFVALLPLIYYRLNCVDQIEEY